ncbi:MAG TPA: phospholipase D-like domain-containing protein [Burkholderiales bacterium]
MNNAVAFADNDVITIAWSYGRKPEGCMGFAVYRIDSQGKEEALPSHAVFKGDTIKPGQKTDEYPVQKFYWKDLYARLIAEKTGRRKFRYKVVPLEGKPHKLKPMAAFPAIISNEVEIAPKLSDYVSAYFNRGLVSTQRVSRALKGKPGKQKLLDRIADPADRLRESLSGDMVEALTGFVARAKSSGKIYAALYELGDPQLLDALKAIGKRLHIVLSNSVRKDEESGATTDGNQLARDVLDQSAGTLVNRMMPSGHIGHNKFLVYVNSAGKPKAVLLGSTNWTPTGLCAQTNNTLVVEDDDLAARYLAYWKKLQSDTAAAGGVARELQGKTLRTWDASGKDFQIDGAAVESWFSPNTPKARSKASGKEKRPPDMEVVAQRIGGAEHAVLFLAFYPGSPSIANWAGLALRRDKKLFVRGCVTNKSASEAFYYELKGATPPKKVKGEKRPVKQDPRVIGAEALDGKVIPKGWQKEILKAGFAIIHDKILVIDPFSDKCVVVTGSHNLGHKASFDNDENLVIVEGNKKLATAYATHVLDVYDHFSWRYMVKRLGNKAADQSLSSDPDEWLDRYFDKDGNLTNAQLKFWLQAAAPA